jgi:hypothetical protein
VQERRRSPATRRRSASWIAEAPGVGNGRAVASRLQRSGALTGLPTDYCTGRDTVHAGFRPDQSSLVSRSSQREPAVDVEACRLQIDL